MQWSVGRVLNCVVGCGESVWVIGEHLDFPFLFLRVFGISLQRSQREKVWISLWRSEMESRDSR